MITLNRKVRFTHPDFTYTGASYTEYLYGSIGLKVNADIRIDISWSVEGVNMTFDGTADTIQRLDGGLSSWEKDGFKLGDTVSFTNTALNNITTTVISLDGDLMGVTAGALTNETVVADAWGETPITSMDFYPNLIPNSVSFSLHNLTDRETIPHYYTDTITTDAANPTVMIVGTNSHGWVTPTDRATIYRLSFTNHIQTFVISHTFNITPIYLADQLTNLQHRLAPAAGSFKDRDCLKYVYTIEGKYTKLDPDAPHTTDGNVEFPKGQTGWFNEFINGRPTTWTKESILYSDNATGAGLTTIDYCKVIDVQARLVCQLPIACKYIVTIMYLPINDNRYINTLTDLYQNFIYERAVVSRGFAAIQGENTNTDYHFLKNVTATLLTINRVEINFQIDFPQTVIDFFDTKDSDDLNFLIFITPQGGDLPSPSSGLCESESILTIQQTAVIMDVNKYECDKDDSTLFQIIDEVQFFEYPHCNGTGYSNFSLFLMDTVVAKAQFHVKQGTTLDPIILNNITAGIIAVKQNQVQEFPLESFSINTSGFLPNCNNIQEIIFEQDRDFIIPTGDCRNTIQLIRMPTLDIAGYSAYELIYPFKVRWEEWRQLQGADRCFDNPTENWMIYGTLPGWSIKFNIKAEVEQTSIPYTTSFEHIVWGEIKECCINPYSVEFNTFDGTGINTYEEVIANDADTFVEATITGDFSGYTAGELYGILTLDAWGIGGVAYSQEIGTHLNVDALGVWYGAGGGLVATLTKSSNSTVIISAYINYLYLPKDTKQFILSARVGYYNASASSSGADCMNEIMMDAFICGELEIMEVPDANTLIVRGQIDTADFRNLWMDEVTLTFVTATTWKIGATGTMNGNPVMSGTVGGNIIKSPTHPYTNANVGDTLQGDITGTINSSLIEINGIGDMQIGCTFFVS